MTSEVYNTLTEKMKNTYNRMCMPVDTNIKLESVILSDENREKINQFLTETKYKEKFISYGLKPINRLMFYGASGTGKTYLSKALANHFGYELLYIDIATALSQGIAAQALKDVFEIGNHIGKAVIFLDECDAICWARDDKENDDTADIRRANNALFQLLDQMNPECVFISATNLFNNLDPAFVRRFNEKLEFFKPSLDDMDKTIQKFLLPQFTVEQNMEENVKKIVMWKGREYTALSYYEIQVWVEMAEKKAIIEGREFIYESDVYDLFMQSMRVKLGKKPDNSVYLYQD